MKKLIIILLLAISVGKVQTANAQAIDPDWGWSLDRATISGTTISPQYGSTNLTTTGSPTTNVDAIRGQGITTNGSSQYYGTSAATVTTNGSWSICYWVKYATSAVAWGLLSPNTLWDGFYSSNGRSMTSARQINFGVSVTAPNIVANRWGHVCFTKNSTTMSAYGNGEAAATNPVTITQTPAFGDQRLYFGVDAQLGGYSNYWNGTFDDIRVYNRQITGGEARMIYYQGVGAHSFNF